jgi:hypothetical protein
VASLEESIEDLLVGSAGITALVGSSTSARIYPMLMPQGATLPALTYQTISETREPELVGQNGLFQARVQINCWAATFAGAAALKEAVRNAIDGTTSQFPNGVFIENSRDTVEVSEGSRPGRLYGKILDVMIWCVQADPTFG